MVTYCVRCRMQRCACAEIARVETRTRFVIVRHVFERTRPSNTGHYAHLALANSELLEYGVRDAPLDETRLVSPGTWLLFPGRPGPPPTTIPERLIVLDGTWSQAKHMRVRLRALRELPFLTLPPPDQKRKRLRRPRHPLGMSTLEAVARAVALFEGEDRAEPLERLYDLVVRAKLPPLLRDEHSA